MTIRRIAGLGFVQLCAEFERQDARNQGNKQCHEHLSVRHALHLHDMRTYNLSIVDESGAIGPNLLQLATPLEDWWRGETVKTDTGNPYLSADRSITDSGLGWE
jgi:hypothetical protein